MILNKKHIVFDWNGTLIDDAWVFVDILNVLLKKAEMEAKNQLSDVVTIDKSLQSAS